MNIHLKNSTLHSVVLFFLCTTTIFANQDLLFQGVKKGNLDVVRQALAQGADVTKPDEDGMTALHWATFHNYEHIVNFLINETKSRMATINSRFVSENKNAWVKILYLQHYDPVWSAVFSPDGNKVLTASRDNTAVLWNLQGNKCATFKHNRHVYSAVFSPDGNRILTASQDYTAVLWDLMGNNLGYLQA